MKVPLNVYRVSSPFTGTVLENIKLTKDPSPNDTRHVVIDLTGSQYEYLEGQSAGVLPPGFNEKGKPHAVRLYSIASHRRGDQDGLKNLSLCVKRLVYQDPVTGEERRGVASNYICDLRSGDPVKLTGPVGSRFLLPENMQDHHYVFIATGTGIAPFRGMLYELFKNSFQGQVWLIFGVQYRADILYEEEFRRYESNSNFHFVTAISREEKTSDGRKVYVQHRLLEHRKELASLLSRSDTLIYICGITGMEKGIDEVLRTMVSTDVYEGLKRRILVEVY